MLFAENNDNGIELHISMAEREPLYNALRHYSAYGKNDKYIVEQVPVICEIMNVLSLPEFEKGR